MTTVCMYVCMVSWFVLGAVFICYLLHDRSNFNEDETENDIYTHLQSQFTLATPSRSNVCGRLGTTEQ
jgi:hypothetical protein